MTHTPIMAAKVRETEAKLREVESECQQQFRGSVNRLRIIVLALGISSLVLGAFSLVLLVAMIRAQRLLPTIIAAGAALLAPWLPIWFYRRRR